MENETDQENIQKNPLTEWKLGSSSSSSSSSESDVQEVISDSGSDSDSDSICDLIESSKNPPKSVSQQQHCSKPPTKEDANLPKIEDLDITIDSDNSKLLGHVISIVDDIVVIEPNKDIKTALDLDSLLFIEKGSKCIGPIFDVFGQTINPFYCVRFNNKEHIEQYNLKVGEEIFYGPNTKHTNYVFLTQLLREKGTDPSWEDDNEPPEHMQDFSDDEEERIAKSASRKKPAKENFKKNTNKTNPERVSFNRNSVDNRPKFIRNNFAPRPNQSFIRPSQFRHNSPFQPNTFQQQRPNCSYTPRIPPFVSQGFDQNHLNNTPNNFGNNWHPSDHSPMYSNLNSIPPGPSGMQPCNFLNFPPPPMPIHHPPPMFLHPPPPPPPPPPSTPHPAHPTFVPQPPMNMTLPHSPSIHMPLYTSSYSNTPTFNSTSYSDSSSSSNPFLNQNSNYNNPKYY